MFPIENNSLIYVAGHNGMAGLALCKKLRVEGYNNLLTASSGELDLRRQADVERFFYVHKPEYVFLLAAKVGGISDNIASPAEYLYDNLAIATNVLHTAHVMGVKKLVYVSSSCIYPAKCKQPMVEEELLTGLPEPTNEGFAIAKIAGLKMCEYYHKQYGDDFLTIIPPNLYGEHDNFSDERAHVISALIRRIHNAKERKEESVVIWGSGRPRREFLHVDDFASGALFSMQHAVNKPFLNMGSGYDISIQELAETIRNIIGYEGEIQNDLTKPDGMAQKLMVSSALQEQGWQAAVSLEEGLRRTYRWFLDNA